MAGNQFPRSVHDDRGGDVNILGGHSIGHSKQKSECVQVSYSELFPRWSCFSVETSSTPRPHTSYKML